MGGFVGEIAAKIAAEEAASVAARAAEREALESMILKGLSKSEKNYHPGIFKPLPSDVSSIASSTAAKDAKYFQELMEQNREYEKNIERIQQIRIKEAIKKDKSDYSIKRSSLNSQTFKPYKSNLVSLQLELKKNGYKIPTNGIYDNATEAAMFQFLKDRQVNYPYEITIGPSKGDIDNYFYSRNNPSIYSAPDFNLYAKFSSESLAQEYQSKLSLYKFVYNTLNKKEAIQYSMYENKLKLDNVYPFFADPVKHLANIFNSNGTIFKVKDFYYTNSISISPELNLTKSEFNQFDKFNKALIDKLNVSSMRPEKLKDFSLVTFCSINKNKMIGYFSTLNGKLIGHYSYVDAKELETFFYYQNKGLKNKIMIYGDDLFGMQDKISNATQKYNIVQINRRTDLKKSLHDQLETFNSISEMKLEKEKCVFFNGFPKTLEECEMQEYSHFKLPFFEEFNKIANKKLANKTSYQITSKKELVTELQSGTNNTMIMTAHCDGNNIYLGSEKIALTELNGMDYRASRNNYRVCVLLSCNTADLFKTRSFYSILFKKNILTAGEIMIEKNFFDVVIAPTNVVYLDEILNIIDNIDKYSIGEFRLVMNRLVEKGEVMILVNNKDIDYEFFKFG